MDASLKTILDCGAFIVVLFKVAHEVWQLGGHRITEGIELELRVVANKETARNEMATLEFETASRASQSLSTGDFCLLDRPLSAGSKVSPKTRRALATLAERLRDRRIGLLGICKSSRLSLDNGGTLIGALLHFASQTGKLSHWYYYPITNGASERSLSVGHPCVVSFNPSETFAFRVDVANWLDTPNLMEKAFGSVAALGDEFSFGYPYPLRSVHEAASISRTEVDICRQKLVEAAAEKGILPALKYALRSTSFREEVLLSS